MLLLVPTRREASALFDDARAPRCEDPEDLEVGGRPVRAALCGFGPAAAGVLAALALARERPRACLLLGLCGTYDPLRLPVGGLLGADRLLFADLGVERGGRWMGPKSLGFEQAPTAPSRPEVVEELASEPPAKAGGLAVGSLLTVARASGSPEEASARAQRWAGALGEVPLGEDMEAFSVGLAAARLGIRVSVVKAASNATGEPDRGRWEVPRALAALRAWLLATRL